MNDPDKLLRRYLDGDASPAEIEEVSAWLGASAENRRRYLREAAAHRQLRDWALARTALRLPTEDAAGPQRLSQSWLRPIALAAGLMILLSGVWWVMRPASRDVQLTHASGSVTWSSENGEWQSDLRTGARLKTGTLTIAGLNSAAQLEFHDGTRVLLTGDGELAFSDGEQKRLNCRRGSLSAWVSPQPKGRPMLVRTPLAEIEVVGTVFAVEAETAATRVMVEEGKVRVRRAGEQSSALVGQSERALIEDTGRAVQIEPSVPPPSPLRWTANLSVPVDESWAGRWLPASDGAPARIAATPNVMERKEQRDIRPVVKLTFPALESRPTIGPETVARLRIRGSQIQRLHLFLSTTRATGAFRGNFEVSVPWDSAVPDAAGWRSFTIPLRDAVPRWAELYPTPVDNCIRLFIVDTRSHEAEFEIAELEILPNAAR
jgi:ferric-dicitrate binding protein FerR (iron transport regulator)